MPRDLGLEVTQADASITLFLRLFSAPLVTRMAEELRRRAKAAGKRAAVPPVHRAFPRQRRALRGNRGAGDPLPAAPRSEHGVPHRRARVPARRAALRAGASASRSISAFGALGTTEQARYLASLYVDDLADVWRLGIDPRFELARYGEKLAASSATFDPLHEALTGEPTLVDETLDELTRELLAEQTTRHRRHHRAVSRQRLRRIPHGAHDPRGESESHADPRRRLGEHRAALASRSARVRLLRLRHSRRRRAAAAQSAAAAERPRHEAACAPMYARATTSCSKPTRCSTTSRRKTRASRPTTACRSTNTCRSWKC